MRHVTLRQLRVFEAVARHRSFSRAADELHLTQPAVSMQVKSLEEQAGIALFEQIGKRIFLTEAGEELYARAHAVARELDAADEALDAMRGLEHGRLTIGIVSTGKYFAPQLLGRFLKAHPGVTLKLSVNNREVMLRELAGNEVDLAITGRPPEELDVVAMPFARHPHVVVAAADHPLAAKKRIALARVAEEPFLMREQGSGTRGLLERLFAEHGLPLKVGMEMPSNETIKQAAMAGMGVSFLSLHTVALELETKRLAVLDVVGLPVVRDWYVVHLAGKRLSPLADALKRFLVEEAARHLCGQETPRARRSAAGAKRL
jgi:DNA-binding transcriptional LysR family regulator